MFNRYGALDAALRRPRRIDSLPESSQYQAGELFKTFYLPTPRTSPYKGPSASKGGDGNFGRSNLGNGSSAETETGKLVDIESPAGAQYQPLAQIVQRSNRDVEVPPDDLGVLWSDSGSWSQSGSSLWARYKGAS